MASLTSLPNELKHEIVSEVQFDCGRCERSNLFALSLTCKALRAATFPLLFYQVRIPWYHDRSARLFSLLRTVLEKPAYAQHIRRAVIYTAYTNDATPFTEHARERVLVERAIDTMQFPDAAIWKRAIFDQNDLSAALVLLLARCTHLERLTVPALVLRRSSEWLRTMLQFASEAPSEVKHLSRFDRLQHFTIPCPGEISDIVDLKVPRNDLLLFFHLPNVVSLDLDTVLSFDNYSALPSCAPAWRQLKTLRLCHSFVSADTVELLLRHAPQLKTLVYDCHLPASAGCLDLGKLRQGLEHVCSTLSSLRVAYEILGDELNPDDLETVVTGSIGSLRNFASLAELEISLIALYGQSPPSSVPSLAQLLPFNLQHLTIADDLWDHPVFEPWLGESTMDLLKAFFQDDWMTATPLLKKFVFDMEERRWASEDYWTEDEPLDELEQLCTNQGLVCIILG